MAKDKHQGGQQRRFKVENKGLKVLAAAYPHDPADFTASMTDYIEDMHAQGWDFVTSTHDGNGYRYFFKAV